MNRFRPFFWIGFLFGLATASAFAALTPKPALVGKCVVTSVSGEVRYTIDGRVVDLKKGDVFPGNGAIVETNAQARAILLFSNQTSVVLDENTRLHVEKFDQEFFLRNDDLRVEPSASTTTVQLLAGRVLISTPQLRNGTSMVYRTSHATVAIRGEKILIETNDLETHVLVVAGAAAVESTHADDETVFTNARLVAGQELRLRAPQHLATTNTPDRGTAGATAIRPQKSAHRASTEAATVVGSIVALTGDVRILSANGSAEILPAIGTVIPVGSVISTGANAEIYFAPITGAVAKLGSNAAVEIEKVSTTGNASGAAKQSVVLALRHGTLVSNIDPTRRLLTDYAVQMPGGTAHAEGTSFAAHVGEGNYWIGSFADTVSFMAPNVGEPQKIAAGTFTVVDANAPVSAVPFSQSLSSDPTRASALHEGFSTIITIVKKNLGAFSSEAATNLIAKISNVTGSAFPAEVAEFASEATIAVNTSGSATFPDSAAALSTVIRSLVLSAPGSAAEIAAAATTAAPDRAATIAFAAAGASPSQSPQVAFAVIKARLGSDQNSTQSSRLQNAAAIAVSVTTAAPANAPLVVASSIQALVEQNPNGSTEQRIEIVSTLAAAVTTAVPTSASAITFAALTAFATFEPASVGHDFAGSTARIAAAVATLAPLQAESIAVAAVRWVVQSQPNATADDIEKAAGLIAAVVSQASPDLAPTVNAAVASAANVSIASIQAGSARSSAIAAQIAQQLGPLAQIAAFASQQSDAAGSAAITGNQFVDTPGRVDPTIGRPDLFVGTGQPGGPAPAEDSPSTPSLVTNSDPSLLANLTNDLAAAQDAQNQDVFTTETAPDGSVNVQPVPTVPQTLPIEFVTSPANGAG